MIASELIRLPDLRKDVRLELREVVRDVFGKPHIFIRVRLTGWRFPGRAPKPFMVIGDVVSRVVIIDQNGLGANGYFDKPLPAAERVSVGYGKIIQWEFDLPIRPKEILRLDRARLTKEIVDPFGHLPMPE
jgi:hypothetical protein